MDKKDKDPKGTAATASKMAVSKKQDESPSPGQGATSSQSQGSGGQDLLQQAKQTTNEVVSQVQQQASSQINRQKETAASELTTVVNAVRRFGETLNNEGQGPIARFAAQYGDKAADSLDRVARLPARAGSETSTRRRPELWTTPAGVVDRWRIPFGSRRCPHHQEFDGSSRQFDEHRSSTCVWIQGTPGTRSSANPGAQQPQSFNKNISGAQQPTPPPNPVFVVEEVCYATDE